MKTIKIGVIADTHGLIRSEAVTVLKNSNLIIHAGDIGAEGVLKVLAEVAPVIAVRGNCDRELWAQSLPLTQVVELETHSLYVLHNLNDLDLDPVAAGFHIVISGHSHQPSINNNNGIIFLNPGSAGPRRFRLPVTVGMIELAAGRPEVKIIGLQL